MKKNYPSAKSSHIRPISVQDVGFLFKQALDKSNPKLQEAAIKLLSLFPIPKPESNSKNKI